MAANPILKSLMDTITHRKATHLILPVNLDNQHWIVAHMDLKKQKYTYGAFSPYCCMPQMLTNAFVHSRKFPQPGEKQGTGGSVYCIINIVE